MTWRTGDTGRTTHGHPYRILADDFRGRVGPIVVGIVFAEVEQLHQYPADGTNPGGQRYLDLAPPKVKS